VRRVDGHTYPTPTHLNYTLFHPVGVCALVSPWNVPFIDQHLEGRAGAGIRQHRGVEDERAVALERLAFGRIGLGGGNSGGLLNVVHGYGSEAGEALCRHPDVRAISFTGSTANGESHRQGRGLEEVPRWNSAARVPFVVFEDADLARALDAAIFMIFSNNGERCTAGSRILVQQSIYAGFVEKFTARAKRITVGDPLDENISVGPMISPEHLAKVRRYIELGPQEGAAMLLRRSGFSAADGRLEERKFRQAHGLRGCEQPHADRAG